MLKKYADRVMSLPVQAKRVLVEEFELDVKPTAKNLVQVLDKCHLTSADVVVVLLRRDERSAAESVAGVKIQKGGTYQPKHPPTPVSRPATRGGDDRKVLWHKQPNPATKGSKFHAHFDLVKDGMTVTQLLARGAVRGDIREWLKRQWIRLEDGDEEA